MCNCKKKPRIEPQVITSIPQTPEELHSKELNEWNGGQKDKQEK